jgi:ATP-dependent RNA helicase RhlE
MTFDSLQLTPQLLSAVAKQGYSEPTPIQQQAIPHVLEGRDLLGIAQTGTGKTAAFALPILQRLARTAPNAGGRPIRCLVLSPTRELAAQIGETFAALGRNTGLRHSVVFGGVGQRPQEEALRRGVDVLVATPGRLLDLMNQGFVRLDRLDVFVLDEADRMLDMGFIHDVRRVVAKLPAKRQTLFFSATMPADVQQLADGLLHDPVRVEVTPVATTAEKIAQSVYFVEKADKKSLLVELLRDRSVERALVFTRTKHGANRLAEQLERANITALAIHGNKSQGARERALEGFKRGTTRVLVATDIAARGIDVQGITHVVNYDLPNVPESYVHRIGRTARAGAEGIAWSLCDAEERAYLRDIEKTIRQSVPVVEEHPFRSTVPCRAPQSSAPMRSGSQPRAAHAQGPRHGGARPPQGPSSQRNGQSQQSQQRSGHHAPSGHGRRGRG